MLLVGLSRARSRANVMVLPLLTSPIHLLSLKWDPKLVAWWCEVMGTEKITKEGAKRQKGKEKVAEEGEMTESQNKKRRYSK